MIILLVKAIGTAVIATLISLPAVAQTRYCLGGDLDHLSAAERASCSAAREMVQATATRLQAPENWHFVIVCGEQGWRDYTAVSQRGEVALEDSSADTDLGERVTYLRESRLSAPHTHGPQRVIAHELASIRLNTQDEQAIEAQLTLWSGTAIASNEAAKTSLPKAKLSRVVAGLL